MTTEQPLLPGFEVHQLLGSGGQATVWRATRLRDGTPCALKVLANAGAGVVGGMSEAAALVRLRHEHLVGVLDVLVEAEGPSPQTVLVLELADGGTLATLLAGRLTLTPGECATVIAPVAAAVASIHRRGAVHGDLHPGNVLFRRNGSPMLSDLGSARLLGDRPSSLGVPGWVAPEVVAGDPVSAPADAFALGVLMWRILSGAEPPPRVGPGDADGVLPSEVPVPVVEIIEQACSWDPSQRPSAERISRALLESVDPMPVRMRGMARAMDDPGHQLTQRLRESALTPTPRAPGPEGLSQRLRARRDSARALRAALPGPETAASADRAARGEAPQCQPAAAARTRLRGRHRAATRPRAAGAVAVVVGALVLTGWSVTVLRPALGEPGPSPQTGSVSSPVHPPTPSAPRREQAQPEPSSPRPAASRAAVTKAARVLVTGRAAVWRGERPPSSVFALGSRALKQEMSELKALRATGARYETLAFVVVGPVEVVTLQHDRASLRLQIRRERVLVRLADGRAATAVDRTEASQVELLRTPDGWRVTEIKAA